MGTRDFYKNLKTLERFEDVSDVKRHYELPEDWFIVITDVSSSTKHIEDGRYKDVNTVGAMAIMGVINIDRTIDIPYIFGGDGATMAVPPEMFEGAQKCLLAVKELAKKHFSIDLRVGVIPVSLLQEKAFSCRVAKYRLSEHLCQAVMSGSGWEMAESLLKSADEAKRFTVPEDGSVEAAGDFTGLECRWNSIPSQRDQKVCIMLQATDQNPKKQNQIYQNLLGQIEFIFDAKSGYHPVTKDALTLSLNPWRLAEGLRAHSVGLGLFKNTCRIWILNLIGKFIFAKGWDTDAVQWSRYKDDLIKNSDYRKFDGMLRLILDGTRQQISQLEQVLSEYHRRGDIWYGIHCSNSAIMTCLIFSYNGHHAHFLDGSEGGYAIAAKQLKAQKAQYLQDSLQQVS